MSVRVDFRSPETQRLETPAGTWLLLADRKAGPEEMPEPPASALAWERVSARFEELTAVFLPRDAESDLPCQAFRGLFSGFELFRVETPEGGLFLTDDFRAAGKAGGKRKTSPAALLDYLLFQYPAGTDTFLPGVKRLGPGEALSVQCGETGVPKMLQAEGLRLPGKVSPGEALEKVRQALSSAVESSLSGVSDAAVLLSGGIDSTLISLFGGRKAIALHASTDSPELAYEEDYASDSCGELGIPLVRLFFHERDFLQDLEETTARLGRPFPVTNFQAVFHNRLFRLPYGLFLSGDIADRLFGQELEPTGNGDDNPISRLVRYCPLDLLNGMFGPDLVRSRLDLYGETLEKLMGPGCETLTVGRKADLLVFFGLNYWIHYFRPLAAAFGKRFIAPFCRRAVFEASMSCPDRHELDGNHPKPLLGEILRKALPGYPVSAKKGGTGVPRTRFCQTGPLRGFFRQHELPSGIDPRFAKTFREPEWETSALVLQAAAFRIWEDTL